MTPQSQFWYRRKDRKITIWGHFLDCRNRDKGPDGAERGIFFPRKDLEDHFGSFSGLSEPSVVVDYKKSVSRASRASMSLESVFHNANYGETMAGNG